LRECEKEHDNETREARFAFRCPILNSTPNWTLVIQFPNRNSPSSTKTYLFQAREENDLLQAFRAEIHGNVEVFQKSTYFGTVETSPQEILEKAKQVETGEFNVLANKKAWLKEFLDQISPELSINLSRKYLKAKREAIENRRRKDDSFIRTLVTAEMVLAAGLVGLMVGNSRT
jgi:hypothetical protein